MRKQIISSIILCIMILSTSAQIIDTAHFRLNYVPQLLNFQKINQQAIIIDTIKDQVQFDYYITPQRIDITFLPFPINAAKIGPEVANKIYRNFLKIGFGYPLTPLAELSVHNTNNTKYSFGLNFHHFSSWAPPIGKTQKKYAYAPTSDTRIHLFFTRFFKNQTLYSSIGYNHELANRYGYNRDLGYDPYYYSKSYRDSIKNDFHDLHGEIGIRSNYTLDEKRLKQDVRLNYDFLYTRWDDMENHIGVKSYFAYDTRFLKISGSQNYRLDFNVDYYNNRINNLLWNVDDSMRVNRYIHNNSVKIELKPTVNFTIKEYHIIIGLGVPIIHSYGYTKCPIYPVAEVQLGLIKGILSLYAGVDGRIEYASLKDLLYENPYLKPQVDTLKFSRNQISIYGGVKGNLVKKLNYHISARYSFVKDMPFFILDTLAPLHNQFDITYSDANCLNVCVNLNWEVMDHLYLNLDANYWGYYFMNKVEHAWYKPAWEIGFRGKYTLKERFIFDLNFKLGFDRWAYIPERDLEGAFSYHAEKMKPILDFGIGFEYLINKQFSVFANINNIACQNYGKYYDFNNFGINVLGGITYSFGNETLKKKNSK